MSTSCSTEHERLPTSLKSMACRPFTTRKSDDTIFYPVGMGPKGRVLDGSFLSTDWLGRSGASVAI